MDVAASDSSSSRWPGWLLGLVWGSVVVFLWWLCFRFPAVWIVTGIGEAHRPFFDLYCLLAARDTLRLGLDPSVVNPLDPYNRPLIYTKWWLAFPSLGLGRKDTLWLGASWCLLVVGIAVAWLKTRRWRDGLVLGAIMLSPAFLLTVNRANNDIIVFATVSLGLVCLRKAGALWQAVGVVAFALAAVMKYYPLVTLLMLFELRSRPRIWAGLALYIGVLLVAWPGLVPGLVSASQNSPSPMGLYAFGAPTLWRNLGSTSQLGWITLSVVVAVAAMVMARSSERLRAEISTGTPAAEREFICGAVMIVGVFFLGASFVYKLIFAIWLVPWLLQAPAEPGERCWRRATWSLLLAVLWLEGLAAIMLNLFADPGSGRALAIFNGALVVQELVDWAFITCLLRFVLVHLGRLGREHFVSRPAKA